MGVLIGKESRRPNLQWLVLTNTNVEISRIRSKLDFKSLAKWTHSLQTGVGKFRHGHGMVLTTIW